MVLLNHHFTSAASWCSSENVVFKRLNSNKYGLKLNIFVRLKHGGHFRNDSIHLFSMKASSQLRLRFIISL